MKTILLVGNPNVGKSAVFSRVTGIHVITSNYPGTTVEFAQGIMRVNGEEATLIDVPGTYGLEATSKAEQIAVRMLEDGDTVVNVVDATNLERNLHLTLHLLEQDVPVIVALNLWDDAKHKGITIDVEKMAALLGVPVVPTVAVTGEGIKELVSRIPEACNPEVAERTEEERWTEVGRIVGEIQSLEHRHHTLMELIGDASVKPLSGIPIAMFVLSTAFMLVRLIGESLITAVCEPLFETLWKPFMMQVSVWLGHEGFLHSVLIGELVAGTIDFKQSFGLLTTGLFVPIAMVLPYVFSFYLVLGFMEDFGYLPRLAVLLDNIMHRMGLHGWTIIPTMLGLGCNVPGVMATRILESRRERMIAATLISIAVPCAALQAMMWGLLGPYGGGYVAMVYLALFIVWIVIGRVLNLVLHGQALPLVMEIPPYRLPGLRTVAKKLWMRTRGFLREAVPMVLLGVLLVNVLYTIRVFYFIAKVASPIVTNLLGLPDEAAIAIVVGFLRKDVAVGMLGAIDLTPKQLVVSVTVLAMSFPCIATFVILAKELGLKDLAKSIFIMLASSLVVGTLLNIIL